MYLKFCSNVNNQTKMYRRLIGISGPNLAFLQSSVFTFSFQVYLLFYQIIRMHQNLSTLNISRSKLAQLREQGKTYLSDLSDSEAKLLAVKPTNSTSISALNLLESELACRSILTFNTELDRVLENEILPGKITELAGLPGSGKTQICFQLCVSTQMPQSIGGLDGQVIYMDTKKNFSPTRISQICHNFKTGLGKHRNSANELLSEENILSNIFVFNIQEVTEMWAAINLLERFLVGKNVKLVIIDSFTHPLKYLKNPLERVPTMYKLLGKLQQLSTIFQFAMVVTNDFTTKIKNSEMYFAPAFGDTFFDRVNSRICLSKCEHFYVAQLVKSVTKSPMSAKFLIMC